MQPTDTIRQGQSFPVAAATVMTNLKTTLAGTLDSCSCLDGTRPIDIAKGLGIDMKLAWKASHLANATQPFDSVRHLPGIAGMRILLDAAVARGADPAIVGRTLESFKAVQSFISRNCGSRRAFESMVAGLDELGDRRLEQEHRRTLFHGARSVWGLKADVLHRLDVLFPSSIDPLIDCATIRTLGGARRLRGGVPLVFPRPRVVDDRGVESRTGLREPLDSSVKRGELPIVHRLCSGEVPEIKVREREEGIIYEAPPLEVADAMPYTFSTGELLRAVQPTVVHGDSHGIYQLMRLRIPSPLAVFDVLVDTELLESDSKPDSYLASELHVSANFIRNVRHVRLPVAIRTREISNGLDIEVPGLKDMGERLQVALEATQRPLSRFRWFRLEVEYPPICSLIAFECEQTFG
ncbi:MAG: hypothetical protein CMJ34_07610 [Phycisphaerae bacterium]|nr:hypothetical protein [Phycisphaerae bacterium]